MKKIIVLFMALLFVFCTACSSSESTEKIQTSISTAEAIQTTTGTTITAPAVATTLVSTTITATTAVATATTSTTTTAITTTSSTTSATTTATTTTVAATTTAAEEPAVLEKITLSMPNGTEISFDDKLIVLNAVVSPRSCETKDIQIVCTPDDIVSIRPSVLPVYKATYIIEPIKPGKVMIQAISGDGEISSEPLEVTVGELQTSASGSSGSEGLSNDVIILLIERVLDKSFNKPESAVVSYDVSIEDDSVKIIIVSLLDSSMLDPASMSLQAWKSFVESSRGLSASLKELIDAGKRSELNISYEIRSKENNRLIEIHNDTVVYDIFSNGISALDNQSITTGQSNALKRAKEYLKYNAFSYSGLISQLEYEKFSHAEAVYGADNCGADWKEQAVKKAKSYLDFTAFSYNGLIDQLEYEGFTHNEAVYGADNCGADWKEQAVKKAASYLKMMSFSKSKLIEQLEYEGFTHEQAVYGAEKNGL